MRKRVYAYYDGSNFYHYLKRAYGITGINFKHMTEQVLDLDTEELKKIKYFNAPVSTQNPAIHPKQQRFLEHIRATPLTELILGKLVKRPQNKIHITCAQCGHRAAEELQCPTCKRLVNVTTCTRHTEKGVDVRLAMALILDALDDRYDVALLFSGDADFAPAVRYVIRKLGKAVFYCRFPGGFTSELVQSCTRPPRIITREMAEAARVTQ